MAPRTRTTRSSAAAPAKTKTEAKTTTTKTATTKRKAARSASPAPKRARAGPASSKKAAPLKGVAAPSRQSAGALDSGFAEQVTAKMLSGAELRDYARLVDVDRKANTDKYYIVQLIQSGKSWFCWQRWGRTGTAGQGKLHKGSEAKMRAEFTDKFLEKTGVAYADAQHDGSAAPDGMYAWLAVAPVDEEADAARWEYYVDDGIDGKATAWYPYEEDAGAFVEEVWRDAHAAKNAHMQLRFVHSGHWTYEVDLASAKGAFTQKNTSTGKVRAIRRVQGNVVTASSPAKQQKKAPAAKKTKAAAAPKPAPRTPPSKLAVKVQASNDDDEEEEEVDTSTLNDTAARLIPSGTVVEGHSATLNQTNISGGNNNNKFYVAQAVQRPNGSYVLFTLWGRVGEQGATQLAEFGPNKALCLAEFAKKFRAKTGNAWAARAQFGKVPGKYDLILTKASPSPAVAQRSAASAKGGARAPHAASRLDPATQDFVSFIFSKDMFASQMAQLNLDTHKLPLGALTRQQVQSAYDALDALDAEINGKARRNQLEELSSRYYTVMPHNFGRARPPVIASAGALQTEYDLVNVIADVEQAQTLERTAETNATKLKLEPHPLDAKFQSLNMADWQALAPSAPLFKKLGQYAGSSSGYQRVKLVRAFQVGRAGEDARFKRHDGLERTLLWHGTNVAVVAAILKSGLRIMPHSGGRVGAGIYLASEHSKSLGYTCGAQHNGKNLLIMFLVEAALGTPMEITRDDSSLRSAPKGFHSVFARGTQSPLGVKDETVTIDGRPVRLPLGAPKPTGLQSSFHQDELLIYDESQHRLRFVLVFEQ